MMHDTEQQQILTSENVSAFISYLISLRLTNSINKRLHLFVLKLCSYRVSPLFISGYRAQSQ